MAVGSVSRGADYSEADEASVHGSEQVEQAEQADIVPSSDPKHIPVTAKLEQNVAISALASISTIGLFSDGQKVLGKHHLLAGKVSHLANAGISKLSSTNFFLGHATWAKVVAFVPKFGLGVFKFFATLLLSHPIILGALGGLFLISIVFRNMKFEGKFVRGLTDRVIALTNFIGYGSKCVARFSWIAITIIPRLAVSVLCLLVRIGWNKGCNSKYFNYSFLEDESWGAIRRVVVDQLEGFLKDLSYSALFLRQIFYRDRIGEVTRFSGMLFSFANPFACRDKEAEKIMGGGPVDPDAMYHYVPIKTIWMRIFCMAVRKPAQAGNDGHGDEDESVLDIDDGGENLGADEPQRGDDLFGKKNIRFNGFFD